ncbi:MAG: hypothetical protein GIW97_06775 [Candidatus Eremiobacteraeota bacterium]|nr:hypothetical protein [Candidatus Eremiobacteraeota bacterium]
MKMALFRMTPRERERSLWLLSVAILAAGYFIITQRYEQQIMASTQRSQTFYEKTNANHRLTAQSGRVRALRGEIRAHLDGVLFSPRPSDATAALLRDLDRLARQHNAQITAIAPQTRSKPAVAAASPSLLTHPGAPPPTDALENEAIDITVRGHFSNLLAFIAQLPRQHVLLRVNQVNFSLSGASKTDPSKPLLDARIHTLVYRVVEPNLLGEM